MVFMCGLWCATEDIPEDTFSQAKAGHVEIHIALIDTTNQVR